MHAAFDPALPAVGVVQSDAERLDRRGCTELMNKRNNNVGNNSRTRANCAGNIRNDAEHSLLWGRNPSDGRALEC